MADFALLIREAVERAIFPGERTGVLLSGGLDSSTVAAFAKLPTFTGYYEGEPYDERRWAKLVADPLTHHEILIEPRDFVENFDALREAVEPPYTGPGMLGQYVVAKYAAQHVDALLSGEGGDELFGGYARLMIVAGHPRPDGYEHYELPPDYPRELEAALAYDYERLQALCRVDEEIAWAHKVFLTPPLLDPEVVDEALALPPERRVGKVVLREAMRGIVPDPILDRTDKRGFPVPFVEWAQREPVKSFVRERIGYVPSMARPWDRDWWGELLAS